MYRLLTVLTLVGLLAACSNQGGGGNADASLEPAGSGAVASTGASADASGGGAAAASAACEEAFAPLAEMEIASLSELGEVPDEVQPTIEACESIADWIAGAQTVVADEINPNSARFLLSISCDDQAVADTPVCEEIASS